MTQVGYARSAQPWVMISDEMLNYEGQPKDVRPLWEKWAEQHS